MDGELRITGSAVKDSRGKPTVSVVLSLGKHRAEASVPSGKSAGSREAKELRDKDGSGVTRAIRGIKGPVAQTLRTLPLDPKKIDRALLALDGTADKSKLGANAILAVSIASRRLAAKIEGIPLWRYIARESGTRPGFPRLYMNMLNGGAHADFALPFQEYIVVVGGRGPRESYARANAIFETLGTLLARRFGKVPLGDEGGYAPRCGDIIEPFRLLRDAAGDAAGVFLAIDAAATEFARGGKYLIQGAPHSRADLLALYMRLIKECGVKSIEDPFSEDDDAGFASLVSEAGRRALVVGDDLTVTNPNIVRRAVKKRTATAMIVKPNQIGTLTEVYQAVERAREAGWKLIASHRSGETKDDFIADLAVGIGAYGMKAGAPTQPERRAKYDRLIAIEREFMKR